MRFFIALTALATLAPMSFAADWEPMATQLLKTEKLGFGGITGLVVDPATGDLFIWLSDKGLWKSTDQAVTFKPHGKPIMGRTEWPGCMQVNPVGPMKTWIVATVYGGPILKSTDDAAIFTPLDKKLTHVDWICVDWSDPEQKFLLTLKHESGDLLLASSDAGKSFREVGKGYGPACIFDDKTAVVVQIATEPKKPARRTLARTTDGAQTFEKVADFSTKAVPVWRETTPYWLVDGAIITSKDKGKSWESISSIKNGQFGPVFGKDDKQMFVLTNAGVVETTDGGKSWSAVIPPPKDLKGIGALTWIGYDPKNSYLYLLKMGTDLYRMKR